MESHSQQGRGGCGGVWWGAVEQEKLYVSCPKTRGQFKSIGTSLVRSQRTWNWKKQKLQDAAEVLAERDLLGQQQVQFEASGLSSKCRGLATIPPFADMSQSPSNNTMRKEFFISKMLHLSWRGWVAAPERQQCTFRARQHSPEFWVTRHFLFKFKTTSSNLEMVPDSLTSWNCLYATRQELLWS